MKASGAARGSSPPAPGFPERPWARPWPGSGADHSPGLPGRPACADGPVPEGVPQSLFQQSATCCETAAPAATGAAPRRRRGRHPDGDRTGCSSQDAVAIRRAAGQGLPSGRGPGRRAWVAWRSRCRPPWISPSAPLLPLLVSPLPATLLAPLFARLPATLAGWPAPAQPVVEPLSFQSRQAEPGAAVCGHGGWEWRC